MNTYYTFMDSSLGEIMLISNGSALTGLYLSSQKYALTIGADWLQNDELPLFAETKKALADYFAGHAVEFNMPLAFNEGTKFQKQVWQALLTIPYGETISYKELAIRIGNPKAVRAVGLANGRNPIAIIVPCHRVIGANGKLVGYGGGLPRKQQLLELETGNQRSFAAQW